MKATAVFFIHDLNGWGGQDRSVLEIARRLSHLRPVVIVSFTLVDPAYPGAWGKVRWVRVRPDVRRPVMLKILYFIAVTALLRAAWALTRPFGRVAAISTGTSSLLSELVQVQFVQATWRERLGQLRVQSSWIRKIYHRWLLRMNWWLERVAYRHGKHYIAISEGVRIELGSAFHLRENMSVIHHGIDSAGFSPASAEERSAARAKLGIPREARVALFVGAFERKNLMACIEALALLPAGSPLRILAVGTGNNAAYERRARELAVSDRLQIVGHSKEILPFYQAADFFLLPSLYEAFGLVVLEAMACGLPSVVSSGAGAAELIRHGENGLLLRDPTSSREIAAALERLSGDGELSRKMGALARETAITRSWDKVAREYDALLAQRFDH